MDGVVGVERCLEGVEVEGVVGEGVEGVEGCDDVFLARVNFSSGALRMMRRARALVVFAVFSFLAP